MSSVGPITDNATQLLGLSSENLNRSADRSVELFKLENDIEMQKAALALQTTALEQEGALATKQLEQEMQREEMRQKGFDKMRESEERIAQKQMESRAAEEQKQRAFQAEQGEQERTFTEKMAAQDRTDKRELEVLRLEAESLLQKGAWDAYKAAYPAIEKKSREISERSMRSAAARMVHQDSMGALQIEAAQLERVSADFVAGAVKKQEFDRTLSESAVRGMASQLALDDKAMSTLRAAASGGSAAVSGALIELVMERPEMKQVFEHEKDPDAARAGMASFLKYVTQSSSRVEQEVPSSPYMAGKFGVMTRMDSVDAPAEEFTVDQLQGVADGQTVDNVMRALGVMFDLGGEGAEVWALGNMEEGKWKGKIPRENQQALVDAMNNLATLGLKAGRLVDDGKLKSLGVDAKVLGETMDLTLAAFSRSNPEALRTQIEALASAGDEATVKAIRKSLENGLRLMEQASGAEKTMLLEEAGKESDLLDIKRMTDIGIGQGVHEAQLLATEHVASGLKER